MNKTNIKTGISLLLILILEISLPSCLFAESKVVEVTGGGKERRVALRDAFRSAIEVGLGVKIEAKTEVERFRLVKDVIFTKSQGFVETYEILMEDPNSPTGYGITIKARVTKGKISKLENLRTMIDLMGNPSILVNISPASGDHPAVTELVCQEIIKVMVSGGYNTVAAPSLAKDLSEDPLGIAALADADVVILGNVHSEITGKHGSSQFPLITSRSTLTAQVVVVETGEIVHVTNCSEGKGVGNTEDASIREGIDTCLAEICNDLLWNMAPKIGAPFNIEISISGMDCDAAGSVMDKIQSSADVEQVNLKRCRDGVGLFKARIACSTADFAGSLRSALRSESKVTGISRGKVEIAY